MESKHSAVIANQSLRTSSDVAAAAGDVGHDRRKYRPEIDGLRAVAVIAVIVNHFSKDALPSGYLGVDIFFVISGFVITGSILGRPHQSFGEGLAGFYSRRIKRLVPALVFCVVLTSLAICLFNPAPGVSLQTGMTALFGASNVYLYSQSTDYFAPSTELNAFTHTWSLGVEEQFYLLFPFLLWLAGFWRLGQASAEVMSKRLAWIIGVLATASLTGFICFYASNLAAVYFLMPFRFWELGAGCLLALLTVRRLSAVQSASAHDKIIVPVVAIALVGTFFLADQGAFRPTLLAIALTCLLIYRLRPGSFIYKILSHPFVVWIGLISYSLYLWHWSILCLSRWTVGIQNWTIPFQVLAMVMMASISYYLVEKPLRFASWHPSRLITLCIGIVASIGSSIVLVLLGAPLQGKLFVGKGGERVASGQLASSLVNETTVAPFKVESQVKECNVTPFLLGANSYRLRKPVDSEFIESCLLSYSPQNKAGPKILLVGDSFAEKLAPHAALLAQRIGLGFGMVFGYGCPYLLQTSNILGPSFPQCRHLKEDLLQEAVLNSLSPGDIVLLRLHLTSKSYVRYPTGTTEPSPAAYDQAIEALTAKIAQKGAHLVLVGPNPNLSTQEMMALNPEWFNSWNRAHAIPLNNSQETIYFHRLDEHLRSTSRFWKGATYVSLAERLCGLDGRCYLNQNGRFLYEDDHHLSPFGHDVIFPALLQALRSIHPPSAVVPGKLGPSASSPQGHP